MQWINSESYIQGLIYDEEQKVAEQVRLAAEAQAAEEARLIAVAEQEERDRQAADIASTPVAPSYERTSGGHSDAWWQGVAVCEQGGKNDPYYGYFSFMDGSSGGKSWDEQVRMGNELLARAGREVGPWAASCVAAGYAASPGG